MTVESANGRRIVLSTDGPHADAARNLNSPNSAERSAGKPKGNTVNVFKLVALPVPPTLSLAKVNKKAGNEKGAFAHLRADTAFTVVENGEQSETTAKNGTHSIDLNREQYAEAERYIAPLRVLRDKGTKATKAEVAAATAIMEEIARNGGIRLPVNRRGAPVREGESIGALFAGIVAAPPAEETTA